MTSLWDLPQGQRQLSEKQRPELQHADLTGNTNARATRDRSARPATSSSPEPPAQPSAHRLPGRPSSREHTRDRRADRGMHTRLAGACQAGTRRQRGPSVTVRGKPTVPPTVLVVWTPSAICPCAPGPRVLRLTDGLGRVTSERAVASLPGSGYALVRRQPARACAAFFAISSTTAIPESSSAL